MHGDRAPPVRERDDEVPTLFSLQRRTPWLWLYCHGTDCYHSSAMALAPLVIRWGIDASSNRLRRQARCSRCGRLGASLRLPSFHHHGWAPFPADQAAWIYAECLAEIASGQMCNLYSVMTNQEAIRKLARYLRDLTGNLPTFPAVFPDYSAPVVRTGRDGLRELTMMRWGFPPPPNLGRALVTNVRNVKSPYWRAWLKPEFRCLIPATSFCEYTDSQPKVPTWFAIDESRPPFFFAGIWRPWTGTRGTKAAPVEGEHLIYSFLTCEANEVVRPVHAKAMPVMLTTEEKAELWMTAPAEDALALQRPLPAENMTIVARGEKQDGR